MTNCESHHQAVQLSELVSDGNLLRDAPALSCLVLAFCPCRLFYALINLPVFDPGRGESVVLLALPDVCVIFGINSVDFCNIGQFRVML